MLLWTISDLQMDLHRWQAFAEGTIDIPEADACVVAGDAFPSLSRSIQALRFVAERMPVVYVPGNRDFYGRVLPDEIERARNLSKELGNMHLLHDDEVVIAGVRFLGATLWTDLRLPMRGGEVASHRLIEMSLNDFKLIMRDEGSRWTPGDNVKAHERSRAFIEEALARPFDGPTVVVSHHAPHPASIHPRYKDSSINAAFASDLSDILAGPNAPEMWVHGGMHSNVDYVIGDTRVLSNSRGYARENPAFDQSLVVEVARRAPVPSV